MDYRKRADMKRSREQEELQLKKEGYCKEDREFILGKSAKFTTEIQEQRVCGRNAPPRTIISRCKCGNSKAPQDDCCAKCYYIELTGKSSTPRLDEFYQKAPNARPFF